MLEALRHNPFIHWYRKNSTSTHRMGSRTYSCIESLNVVRKYFNEVNVKFFIWQYWLLFLSEKQQFLNLAIFLDKIDNILLSTEFIGKYAWIMAFTMKGPKEL